MLLEDVMLQLRCRVNILPWSPDLKSIDMFFGGTLNIWFISPLSKESRNQKIALVHPVKLIATTQAFSNVSAYQSVAVVLKNWLLNEKLTKYM